MPLDESRNKGLVLLQKVGHQFYSESHLDEPISHRFHPLEEHVVFADHVLEENSQPLLRILSKQGLTGVRSFEHVLEQDQKGLNFVIIILIQSF